MNGSSPLERLRQVRVLASLHDEVLDTFARIAHEEEYASDR